MPEMWIPGVAGPLEDLVARIHRRIESFAAEHGLDGTEVEVQLWDGALLRLASLSPEPGSGFLTLVPHPEDTDGEPQELIVPLAAVRQLRLSRSEPDHPLGFSLPSA